MKEFLIPLGLSFITGTVLGLEREMAHKPAGLRTQVLVNLGTTDAVRLLQFSAQASRVCR